MKKLFFLLVLSALVLGSSQRVAAQCYSSYTATSPICSGLTATLTATNFQGVAPFTNQWFYTATGQLVGVGQTIVVAPTTTTSYYGISTDVNGCTITGAPVWVTVYPATNATIIPTFSGPGQIILTGNGGLIFQWTNGATSQTISPTTAGSYAVTATDANGCQGTSDPLAVVFTQCGTATAPTANFVASATSGCTPFTVQYTSTSTGNPASYNWTFQGGTPGTSTAQNPTVTYNTPGTYNVTLIATNSAGSDSENKVGYVTVSAPPTATFTSTVNNWTVSFIPNAQGALTYLWDFGDGSTSTLPNPTYTYASCDANYTVTLTVTNACGTSQVQQVVGINTVPIGEHIFAHHNNSTPEGLSAWVCQGDTLFLTATQGTAQTCLYTWSPAGVGKTIKFIASGPNASTGSYPIQCNVLVAATGVTTTYTFTVNVVNCISGTDGEKVKAPSSGFGESINLFPNPTRGKVSFTYAFETPTDLTVHVVSPLGQIVYQNGFGVVLEGKKQLELASQPAGTYIVVFGNGQATATKKLIIQ